MKSTNNTVLSTEPKTTETGVKIGPFRSWSRALVATVAIFATAATGIAGAIRPGFNSTTLAANDDSSTGLVNIGFSINFLGGTYSRLYVNNNGNLTFDRALSTFTPLPISSANMRIIAPFWADVDTRGVGSEPVRYGFGTGVVNGRNAFGASYVNVGYYNARADKLNSFQIVIVDRSDVGPGDFDVEFNYDKVQWETGSSSGGSGGLGGSSARAGFANGAVASLELAGSGLNGSFLDSNPQSGLIHNSLNSGGVAGRYVFQMRSGGVLNSAPVARADSATTNEDAALGNINVLGNDTDANNHPLSVTAASSANGAVTINANSTLNFSPSRNFNGPAVINYTISDGNGGIASSVVNVTVNSVNDAPTAANDTAAMRGNSTLSGIAVLANDSDVDGNALSVTSADSLQGVVTINPNGTLNFTPATDFTGAATIRYTVSDGNGGSATATVAVQVNAPNRAPIAANDSFVIAGRPAPYTIVVLSNDSDSDGDALTVIGTTDGASGTATTDGTVVIFTPAGAAVDDTFTYTVGDGYGGTSTASVRIISTFPLSTLAASVITPRAATLNASLNPSGLDTSLAFEYSTNADLSAATTTGSVAVGSGTADITTGIAANGLLPNTRYYFRAVATNSAGVFLGAIKSFLTPIISWGPTGAATAAGLLDATRIPNTASATTFTNISGLSYDVVMTTASLGRNGYTAVTGTPAWWFEGSAPTAVDAATVRMRFYQTGTTNPHGISGVRFQIDDAEQMETLSNFHYFTASGEKVYVPWNDTGVFTYSNTPSFGANHSTVENGATYEGGTQSGKWVDVNLSSLLVSGIEFQIKRRTLSAGTVIMSSFTTERETLHVGGNFAPLALDTDASGFAEMPDYTATAVVRGTGTGVTLTQSPAAGTPVPAGGREVIVYAEDSAGNRASTGFNITIRDKTAPVATLASSGAVTLVSPEPLPSFADYVDFRDNVGVTRIVQSPAAGTATTVGTFPVSLTAYDAAGNVATRTIEVTVEPAPDSPMTPTTVVSKGAAIAGAGTNGVPAGAVFKSFRVPSIAGNRAVAFAAGWTKGPRSGVSLFAGNPPLPVVTVGEPAAGMSGPVFSRFLDPVLNANGTESAIAFIADVTGTGITTATNGGVWTNLGGSLQLIAAKGGVAPGANAQFKSFSSISMVGDEVLIVASLTGASVATANDIGAWRWTAATGLQLVLREGQTMLASTVGSFQMLANVAMSAGHGRSHLDTGYYAARVTLTNSTTAAVIIDFTGVEPVAFRLAESRKVVADGVVATSVGIPSGNTFGSAAFVASYSNGTAIVASTTGAGGTVTNRFVARRGETAVDAATWYSFRDPVMNAADHTAWVAKLSGATTESDDVVAFCAAGGVPAVVAREGSAAAGTAGVFASFKSVALPDGAAGPVFTAALLTGVNNVTTANDLGLWATTSTGEAMLICREGESFGGGIVKAFSAIDVVAGSSGQSRSFNGTNDLLVLVTFEDGAQSIVRVSIP